MMRYDELTVYAPRPGAYRDAVLERMWRELVDVPYEELENGEMVLEQEWAGFPAGTEREEIWHWFDDYHSKGVHYLLYEFDAIGGRSQESLDILAVWDDQVQYLRAHLVDDDLSPDGQAHDLQSFSLDRSGAWDHFDAGVLWGYASVKEAVESELGFDAPLASATLFDISGSDLSYRIEKVAEYHAGPWSPPTRDEVLAATKSLKTATWGGIEAGFQERRLEVGEPADVVEALREMRNAPQPSREEDTVGGCARESAR